MRRCANCLAWTNAREGRAKPWRAAAKSSMDASMSEHLRPGRTACRYHASPHRARHPGVCYRLRKSIYRRVLRAEHGARRDGTSRDGDVQHPSRRGGPVYCSARALLDDHWTAWSGLRTGTFRGQPLSSPLATVCATDDKNLVVPFITKHFGAALTETTARIDARRPIDTVTGQDHHAISTAFLSDFTARVRALMLAIQCPR